MANKKCHDCPQFLATSDTIWENDKPVHYVKCMNSDICREIRRYLIELETNRQKEGFDDECGTPNTAGDM